MEHSELIKLSQNDETPKLEFKIGWYSGAEALDDKGIGELCKDLISLANGNVGFTNKMGYLIIGLDDKQPIQGQDRLASHIPAQGELSDLQKLKARILRKLHAVCSPSLPDLGLYFTPFSDNINLLVVEIPPPARVIKLDSDLLTRGSPYRKGTVLFRVGQDVCVASPDDVSALNKEYQLERSSSFNQIIYPLHNLPQPDHIRFIGRDKELEQLQQSLHPKDRIWTIVIDGVGGIGKSALALEISRRYLDNFHILPHEERFKAIVWVSAKSQVLTAEGILPRPSMTQAILDIYRAIAVCLEKDEITKAPSKEQKDLINRALSQCRTLLVIDNFETVDDPQVMTFIRELPSPTKCIVTTRHRIDIADPIRLVGLSPKEGVAFIEQECSKKDVVLKPDQIEHLYKRTGGLPLAIVWCIAQIGSGCSYDTVMYGLGSPNSDVTKFCFENAVRLAGNRFAYDLLVCICISEGQLSRSDLGIMTGLSDIERDEGLVLLNKLSLINNKDRFYSIIDLVKDYVLSDLANFSFEKIKGFVLRLTSIYAPAGGNAILLIQQFFQGDHLTDLKEEVSIIIINDMYQYNYSGDDYGLSLCYFALESIDSSSSISELKSIINGTLANGNAHSEISYIEQAALMAVGRYDKGRYLAGWLAQKPAYLNYITPKDIIHTLAMCGEKAIIPIMEQIKSSVAENLILDVQNAIEAILHRDA
jgi:hypothetical protein